MSPGGPTDASPRGVSHGTLQTDATNPRGERMATTHYLFDRITLDPERCFGKPCIRGLRMPVTSLLAHLASGMTIAELLAEWPELEEEDIRQAFGYAAWATDEKTGHVPAPAS